MVTPADSHQLRRDISFWRDDGPAPFVGKLFVCGDTFEDFELKSRTGRVPQDAHEAALHARDILLSGKPDAYKEAVDAIKAVSSGYVIDARVFCCATIGCSLPVAHACHECGTFTCHAHRYEQVVNGVATGHVLCRTCVGLSAATDNVQSW